MKMFTIMKMFLIIIIIARPHVFFSEVWTGNRALTNGGLI